MLNGYVYDEMCAPTYCNTVVRVINNVSMPNPIQLDFYIIIDLMAKC